MPVTPTRARVLAVASCGGCAFIDLYATQPLLPELRTDFGAGEAAVGATLTAITLGIAMAAPLVGPLADRLGRKRVIVTSLVLLALATFGAASARTLPALIAWRFAQGVVMPGVFTATLAYIAEEFAPDVGSAVVGAYINGNVIGGFIGRFGAAAITAHFGWTAVFLVFGAINLASAAFIGAVLPSAQSFRRSDSIVAAGRAMLGFLSNRVLLSTYVVGGAVLFSLVAAFTFVTYLLAAPPYGLSTEMLGYVFVTYLVGVFTTVPASRLIGRIGHRRVVVLAIAAGASGLAVTLAPSVVAVAGGLTLLAAAVFVCQTASQGFVGYVARANRSSAAALYLTVYYTGGGLGAIVPAWAWSRGGWPATVALIVAVQALAATVAFAGMRLPRGQESPGEAAPT